MTRIVAGVAGGRRLSVPTGRDTRPTSERAREGLFSTLDALQVLAEGQFLDLYAGSGAVGLEALSRGASAATFVEHDAEALRCLRRNVDTLGLPGAHVIADRVERWAEHLPPEATYNLAYADPPYALPASELGRLLQRLAGALSADAVVVVERASRDQPWTWPEPFQALQSRRYGDTTLWYGRAS